MATSDCTGLSCGVLGPPMPAQEVPAWLSDAPDGSAPPAVSPAKAACGVGSCLPDDATQCADYVPPVPPGSADAGVDGDASVPPENLGDAGVSDAGTEGPTIDGSFTQPTRPAPGPPRFACQLTLGDDTVSRACGVAGSQRAEQACTSSLDCAPGLGCVGPARSGRCLPYCCGVDSDDSCAEGFYCAERPLRSDALGDVEGPLVPVCDRADNCSLGEEENCTGPRCVCGPDSACQLVRPDRTTACVKLADNPGRAGQACPCDRGYHCSQATTPAVCVKTCDLDAPDTDTCGSGVCQSAPVLPEGWGICVGATPEQMMP